jgi:hypothetical protein
MTTYRCPGRVDVTNTIGAAPILGKVIVCSSHVAEQSAFQGELRLTQAGRKLAVQGDRDRLCVHRILKLTDQNLNDTALTSGARRPA